MVQILRKLKWIAPLFVLLLLLCPTARAADAPESLSERVDAFRQTYGLNSQNFAVSFLDLTTKERFDYNETTMMFAASTFKLPLNLYYYEEQAAGNIDADTYIADAGCTLSECHRLSLVYSDNDVSIAMLYRIGDFYTYKTTMRRYFTMTDDEIDPKYYWDNYYCTRMMLDALQYLYEHREQFPEMLQYMTQAQQDSYFCGSVQDCAVAHKYGFMPATEGKHGMIENDVGIIYAEHPFLLAVYSEDVGDTTSRAAELFRDYVADAEHYRITLRAEHRSYLAEKEAAFLQGRTRPVPTCWHPDAKVNAYAY